MAHCYEQGILSHTLAARPFWAADVDVTRRCAAPRLHGASGARPASSGTLRRTLARVLSAIAGR